MKFRILAYFWTIVSIGPPISIYILERAAFAPPKPLTFIGGICKTVTPTTSLSFAKTGTHTTGCTCASCVVGLQSKNCPKNCVCSSCVGFTHNNGCSCAACNPSSSTRLFADATEDAAPAEETEDAVPAEVEALDGIASDEEAHNEERKDNRGSLKKHKREAKGTPITDLEVGAKVTGKVKTIAAYGAFVDIGCSTDGLLHISRLSNEFVGDVNEILTIGQEVEVRISNVDTQKNQVALSMITAEEEANQGGGGQRRERAPRQDRRDDSAAVKGLGEKGFDADKFVEGEVVSTVAFGAFVRVNTALLNAEVEGELDGLVHISSLAQGRTNDVTDVVKVGDKVQVRCKGIDGSKVSLSLIKAEDEQQRGGGRNSEPVFEGAKDWKESLEKFQVDMPAFINTPTIVDNRK